MPLLKVVSDTAEFRKIRDTTLVSLSSQPQNFNFCNFFFKTSGTKSSSGFCRKRFLSSPNSQKVQSTDICSFVNTLFGKIAKNFIFANYLALPDLSGNGDR